MKIWIYDFSRKNKIVPEQETSESSVAHPRSEPSVWLNDSVWVLLLGLQGPRMPTAEVLCTHQGVSQSRGKSSCPAQGSPVFVINNPDLKCGYCFQCIHQLEKQKKTCRIIPFWYYPFLLPWSQPHLPCVCVWGGVHIRLCYTYRSQRTSMSSSITFHVTILSCGMCVLHMSVWMCERVSTGIYVFGDPRATSSVVPSWFFNYIFWDSLLEPEAHQFRLFSLWALRIHLSLLPTPPPGPRVEKATTFGFCMRVLGI